MANQLACPSIHPTLHSKAVTFNDDPLTKIIICEGFIRKKVDKRRKYLNLPRMKFLLFKIYWIIKVIYRTEPMLRCKILCLGIFGHKNKIFFGIVFWSYNTLGGLNCISRHTLNYFYWTRFHNTMHKRSVSIVNTKTNKLIYNRLRFWFRSRVVYRIRENFILYRNSYVNNSVEATL